MIDPDQYDAVEANDELNTDIDDVIVVNTI